MLKNKWLILISSLMVAAFVLVACAAPAAEPEVIVQTVEVEVETVVTETVVETVVEQVEVVVTEIVEVEITPEPVARNGAWLDRIVYVVEPSEDVGVARLQSGDIDIYANSMANADLFNTVREDPNLSYTENYGLYDELTINTGGDPVFANAGTFNPFSNQKIREAMNWVIDRNYLVQEIWNGLAAPRFTFFGSAMPDAARVPAAVAAVEALYGYDFEKGSEVITAEMEAMGAELVDGQWTYEGEVIELTFLIRSDGGASRQAQGDYMSDQLEELGFTVNRQYGASSDLSPFWIGSDPEDGTWHLYTGAWITTAIARDAASNFGFFGTATYGLGVPLWQQYKNSDRFEELAEKLNNSDFATIEERNEMMAEATLLVMQEANRIFLNDRTSFTPKRNNVVAASDLSAGVASAQLLAATLRFDGEVGGTMIFANENLFVEPWNPIDGSNWAFDSTNYTFTGDRATLADPYTGLPLPNRIERVEMTADSSLPMAANGLSYFTLETVDGGVEVPADAWADWDAVEQRFIPASEAYTETQTALIKDVVYYPEDLWETVKWHDGSYITMGDFVMGMIMNYDRGKVDSAIYDESADAPLQSFLSVVKGVRVVSVDPLVIETYHDDFSLDAESSFRTWWPFYAQGQAGWPAIAITTMAESNQELAYSNAKAEQLEVDQMSLIGGPSLEILRGHLETAAAEGMIPYANTMGEYVTAEEAAERYANLLEFNDLYGHFWVGTGLYVLDKVFPVARNATLARFEDHPDSANKWDRFSEAPLANAEVDGPGRVTTGEEATFEVYVTGVDGEAYPSEDIQTVRLLVFDATGQLKLDVTTEAVGEGVYSYTFSGDETSALEAGAGNIKAVVASKRVAIPTFVDFEFVATE